MRAKRAKNSNNGTKILIVVLILLIISAGTFLGYRIMKDRNTEEEVSTIRGKRSYTTPKRRNKRSSNLQRNR